MSIRPILFSAIGLAAIGLALVADPAAAASALSQKAGDEIVAWGQALLLGVAGLVGIPALVKRDVNMGLVVVVLALLLGGLVFAPGVFKDVINTLWQAFA